MKKILKKPFAVLTAVLMLLCMLPTGVFAEGDIPIDEAHFPDANFREIVLNGFYDWYNDEQVLFDTDGSGALSPEEIAAIAIIDASGHNNIADLTGIEYFTALEELRCGENQLTALDVSHNTALTNLSCGGNQLTQLDVSKNTALEELRCGDSQLTQLDVSKNTALEELRCGDNQLTLLDVSNNTALTVLDCCGNQLTSLNVNNNTALTYLDCNGNQLTSLDISKNTALETLWCRYNQLTLLDVSNNTALTGLECGNNKLTELDVSNNTALIELDCWWNQLTQLDVSNNTALRRLWCDSNQLTSLDLSANTNLLDGFYDFRCRSNSYRLPSVPFDLTELPEGFDVSKASDWQGGSVSGNILTFTGADLAVYTYDCGNNHYVEFILLAPESFTPNPPPGEIAIDKAHFPDVNFRAYVLGKDTDGSGALSPEEIAAVTSIVVVDMYIADLTGIEYFTALTKLDCFGNQLTSLDVSNNTALMWLLCFNNRLTELDVTNNAALTYLDCNINQLTSLDISKNTALETLYCDGNQLTSLDISKNTALETLWCRYNQLTLLDVSNNTALIWLLDCSYNQLTSLDVSQNTALERLGCSGNQLTSLDVSKNTALEELWCSENQLTSLDVSKNTALEELLCSYNQYKVSSNPFDLTALPGNFDVTKASNWQDGSVSGSILTFDEGSEKVTYAYDCGNGRSAVFTLILSDTAPGDYDCDGEINVQDAILTLRAAMGLITPSEQALINSDINGDKQLTVQDAILVLRMAMGLI